MNNNMNNKMNNNMKYNMNKVLTIVALLLTSVVAWAGDVRTVIMPSENAGTVQASQSDGICTLTVTPASGYYITSNNLTAVKIIDGGFAQAPRRTPGVDDEEIIITPTNANADPSGVTTYTFTMPEDDNYGVEVTAEFQQRNDISHFSISLTGVSGLVYDGQPKTPEVELKNANVVIDPQYYDVTYENNVNAGSYTAKAIITGKSYYTGTNEISFSIAKATIDPTVTLAGWTFGATANTPVVEDNTGNGTVTFTYAVKGTTNFSATVPTAAGDYTIKASIAATDNYEAAEVTADFTINKALATITKAPAAIANLAHTGEAQALITAGEADGGELQYKLGSDGTYGTSIPTATAAGTYTVYYKVVGDDNHIDVAESSFDVTISKASINPTVTLTSWTYGSNPNEPEVGSNPGNGAVTISYKQTDAETFSTEVPSAPGHYIVKAVIAETANYFGGEATAEFSIVNKTLVAEEVFVNNNTYATYYNSQEDILLPEGVVAYIITGLNGTTLATQALSYIPQNTPVLLEKNDGTVTRNDDFSNNLLVGTATNVTVSSITNGVVYVLYNNQFVKSVSGSIPTGHAYLVLDKTAGAPACLFFDFNDSTGINVVTINVNDGMTDADWYTLDGRKLHQKPSKNGLYIKNGKKIVVGNK